MENKKIGELTPRQFAFILGKEINDKAASAAIQQNRVKKLEVELAKVTLSNKKYKKDAHDAIRDRNKAIRKLRKLQLKAATLQQHNDALVWADAEINHEN